MVNDKQQKLMGKSMSWLAAAAALSFLAGCSGGGLSSIPMPSLPDLSALSSLSLSPEEAKKGEPKPIDVVELANPGTLGDKTIGKTTAPVTIIEYASLACAPCVSFNGSTLPKLKKAYIDKGKVIYVLREFPEGQAAAAAAIAARCVPDKEFFKVIDKYYAAQQKWAQQDVNKEEIYKVVQSVGLKRDKFDACFANQSINDALVAVKQKGTSFGVTTTPTFFINGKMVAGAVSFEEMQSAVETALAASPQTQAPAEAQAHKQRPAAATSGEKQPS